MTVIVLLESASVRKSISGKLKYIPGKFIFSICKFLEKSRFMK